MVFSNHTHPAMYINTHIDINTQAHLLFRQTGGFRKQIFVTLFNQMCLLVFYQTVWAFVQRLELSAYVWVAAQARSASGLHDRMLASCLQSLLSDALSEPRKHTTAHTSRTHAHADAHAHSQAASHFVSETNYLVIKARAKNKLYHQEHYVDRGVQACWAEEVRAEKGREQSAASVAELLLVTY